MPPRAPPSLVRHDKTYARTWRVYLKDARARMWTSASVPSMRAVADASRRLRSSPADGIARHGGNRRGLAVTLAGDDQRVERGGAIIGIRMTSEEPVPRPELAGRDRILIRVGVEASVALAVMRGVRPPVAEQMLTANSRGRRALSFLSKRSAGADDISVSALLPKRRQRDHGFRYSRHP